MSLQDTVSAIGLGASGLTAIVRAVVPQTWLLHKPLSCDLCMSWWSSLALTATLATVEPMSIAQSVVTVAGGVGGALLLTKTANRLSL